MNRLTYSGFSMIKSLKEFVTIGGGAAGVFAALAAKEAYPAANVVLLEKSAVLLSKVRVSGGGRCNVTHACFEPRRLIHNYPRGSKELLGPFHRFQPLDTIAWFEKRGVRLKTEADGRMFPITDSSQTIIDCLIGQAKTLGVEIRFKQKIDRITFNDGKFNIFFVDGEEVHASKLLLATGSSPEGYQWAKNLGHTIQNPVPSLFTFNIPHFPLTHLSGISLESVTVKLENTDLSQTGPLLITHFGLSGPAVLKLSAFGARYLHSWGYKSAVSINWLPSHSEEQLFQTLRILKQHQPAQSLRTANPFRLPKNLWNALLDFAKDDKLISFTDKDLRKVAQKLKHDVYQIDGKTTHKEEFVTCGGISLHEVDFKTLQSKICPGLYFAGEILDIDGVTGGFNFQNAWTTGYLVGKHAYNDDSSPT